MDLEVLGTVLVALITTLGLRDAIKLYILRKEGCGKAKCFNTINKLSSKETQQAPDLGP